MHKLLGILMTAFIVVMGLFVGSMPAQATPHIFEDEPATGVDQPIKGKDQVCAPLSSGKIDLSANPSYYDIVLDDPTMVITGYCAKAGSVNQGEGPEYFPVPSLATYRITHSSGKDLSHVSWSIAPKPIVVPVDTVITVQPEAPTGFDYCGTRFDEPTVPIYGASQPFSVITTVTGNVTTITLVPNAGFVFAEGITTSWSFPYTDVVCPVFIVEQPVGPTDCKPLPDDTDQYYYVLTGDMVFAVAKPGYIFQQDMIVEWRIVPIKGTSCDVIVPPVVEVPPVVDVPPVEIVEAPPVEIVDVSVDDAPVVPNEVQVPIVPASVEVPAATSVEVEKVVSAAQTGMLDELPLTGAGDLIPWVIGAFLALGAGAMLLIAAPRRRATN